MSDEIIRDADRFAFIRDHLIQSHSMHMGGQHSYRLNPGWLRKYMRGPTFADAVDSAMCRFAEYAGSAPVDKPEES